MTEKRKQTQEYIIANMKKADPSGKNAERYTKLFASMSDKDFHEYMLRLKNKQDVLVVYSANMVDKINLRNLLTLAKELGVELFERIRLWDEPTQSYYLSPNKYCILQMVVRRMSQFVDHKLAVADGDSRIDLLTGQVAKPDKAGSISQVEIQTLYAKGLENTILELIKYRGGDVTAFAEFKRELEETGKTTIARETGSVVRSAVVLDVLLSGMHIEANASGL